jgi:hypothetical protein
MVKRNIRKNTHILANYSYIQNKTTKNVKNLDQYTTTT